MSRTKELPTTEQNFLLFDKITPQNASAVVGWIISANMDHVKHPYLTLHVCSEGGELSPAFAIIDAMNHSGIPVRTIAYGEILSSGFMIFINGVKGHRQLMPNTAIMSHRFSAGIEGKMHELRSFQVESNNTHDRMVQHYMRCSGLSKAKVDKMLLPHEDVWLKCADVLELGCADSIIGL